MLCPRNWSVAMEDKGVCFNSGTEEARRMSILSSMPTCRTRASCSRPRFCTSVPSLSTNKHQPLCSHRHARHAKHANSKHANSQSSHSGAKNLPESVCVLRLRLGCDRERRARIREQRTCLSQYACSGCALSVFFSSIFKHTTSRRSAPSPPFRLLFTFQAFSSIFKHTTSRRSAPSDSLISH